MSPRPAVVFAILLSLAPTSAVAEETLRVAAISPLSGSFGLIGEETIKQLKGAAELINAKVGVFDGRKIEIVALDGKANPQDSLIALNAAIDGGVHYVVAHISSVNHALSDAIVKHNTRHPDRRGAATTAQRIFDYITAHRAIAMLARAVDQARSDDPLKVAYALEGMVFEGPAGRVWMRAEDHQLIAALYLARLSDAGDPGVSFDVESTGLGWKAIAKVEGKDLIQPIKCTVERPAM